MELRRIPNVFSRVLQLPFPADADVSVQEAPNCFRFIVSVDVDSPSPSVEAHIFKIHPGFTKVKVSLFTQTHQTLTFDDLHLDLWRIRLPESTLPELSTASIVAGQLVVTVPKTPTPLSLLH